MADEEINIKKLKKYGRRKNWKAIFNVIIVVLFIIIFVIVLAISQSLIINKNSSIAGFFKDNLKKRLVNADYNFGQNISIDDAANILASSDLVKDLPKNALISLKIGDNYYSVTKGKVERKQAVGADISISIPERYINEIQKGLCTVVSDANKNSDIEIQRHISQASLLWKYKSMLKYRDCIGI